MEDPSAQQLHRISCYELPISPSTGCGSQSATLSLFPTACWSSIWPSPPTLFKPDEYKKRIFILCLCHGIKKTIVWSFIPMNIK